MINKDGAEIEHGMVVYEPWKGGYYRKSEADAYIRRLDNHHKYRRCLDKAKLCERLCLEFKDLFYSTNHRELEHAYNLRIEHYYKWRERWLKLAKKFKEAR